MTLSLAIVLALLGVAGCGGPAYEYDSIVTGTVTVDDELAKSGTVTFHPAKKGQAAVGRIHPDGSYSLRTGQGDLQQVDGGTVMSGEYLVTVSITAPPTEDSVLGEGGPPIPGPSLIAAKYALRDTTDLRFTVDPGKQVIVLDLERAEPAPPEEEPAEATDGEPPAETPTTAPPDQSVGAEAGESPPAEAAPETPPENAVPSNAAPENTPATGDASSSESSADKKTENTAP